MKSQDQDLIIPLPTDTHRDNAYIAWLFENGIKFQSTETVRQSPGFPPGWACNGPAFKFNTVEDAMAFKLRWL